MAKKKSVMILYILKIKKDLPENKLMMKILLIFFKIQKKQNNCNLQMALTMLFLLKICQENKVLSLKLNLKEEGKKRKNLSKGKFIIALNAQVLLQKFSI